MSQSDAPFHNDPDIDDYLIGIPESEQTFTPAQLDGFFAEHQAGRAYSYTNSDRQALDGQGHWLNEGPFPAGDSSNSTTVSSMPNFSNYTFGEAHTSAYTTPDQNSPHPYPLQHQDQQNSRVQQPPHRRSLSQGDADRIAAAIQQKTNPVFFRLQVPRSRSAAPDGQGGRRQRKLAPHAKDQAARNADQRQAYVQTDMYNGIGIPTSAHTDMMMQQNILVPTEIGTSLESSNGDRNAKQLRIQLTGNKNSHYFAYMSHREQINKSRKIIEIGAMAVVHQPSPHTIIQPRYDETESKRDRIIKQLDEVEKQLKQEMGDEDESLRGCEIIRDALARKLTMPNVGVEGVAKSVREDVAHDDDDVLPPSTVYSKEHDELYSTSDGGIFALMKQEETDEDVAFEH